MSDPILDKMIADLKEGAERSEGFMRGGRATVTVARDHRGTEHKLAAAGGAIGGAMLGPLGGALGAGMQDGSGMSALGGGLGSLAGGAGGAALGGFGGMHAGHALAGLMNKDQDLGALIGMLAGGGLGGMGGSALGGHLGQNVARPDEKKQAMFSTTRPSVAANSAITGKAPAKPPPIPAPKNNAHETSPFKAPPKTAQEHYDAGVRAALERFGVKEAIAPLIGAIAGPMLARKGLGMAAGRLGGGALGRAAGGALNMANAGGMRGMAFDQAASMAGGALGQKMQGQPN